MSCDWSIQSILPLVPKNTNHSTNQTTAMGESCLGIVGKDYVLLAADASAGFSIILMKNNEDKIIKIDENKILAANGENGDRVQFCEYIQKNMNLYRFVNERSLSPKACANYIRGELASALRKNPYNVNLLLGGFDESEGPQLFYIDYLSSMQSVQYGAHGYGSYFALAAMDKYYHKDFTLDEGKDLMKKCLMEIKKRLVVNAPNFIVKLVDKDGVREVDLGKFDLEYI
jgi:20S proteasome subunit beta 4